MNSPDGGHDDHHDPDHEDQPDRGWQAVPEAVETDGQTEDRDGEDVQDPLDEDGPERPAQRGRAVHLEQVGAIDIAELGRHHAIDEPRDVQDLDRVAQADDEPGLAQEPFPAIATQREPEVEDDERERDIGRVRLQDQLRDRGQPLPIEVQEEGDDPERDDDRQDRPRLAQPLTERDLRDVGRFVLERFQQRIGVVVRDRGVGGGCGLHRTGPYRTDRLVDHRTMVLPARLAHDRGSVASPGSAAGPAAIRRLPRT